MEKISKTWAESFYGADVEDYKPQPRVFVEKESLLPVPSVAMTLPMKGLPLRGDSSWIDCFHPEEDEPVKEFVQTLEAGGNDYLPPSWSNDYVGTAAAEQQQLKLAHVGAIRSNSAEMNTLVKDEAFEKKIEGRFAAIPVSVVKQEPSIALKKVIRYDPQAIERELPTLIVTLPLAKSAELNMPALDNIDDDFCNVNDLLPLEAIESFLESLPTSPTSSIGQENDPEFLDRRLKDVTNKIKSGYKPEKRAALIEPQPMPIKKARKQTKDAQTRIIERRSNKTPTVKKYITKKQMDKLTKDVDKAMKVKNERANFSRAEERRTKPSFDGKAYNAAHPPTANNAEEEAPQLHLR